MVPESQARLRSEFRDVFLRDKRVNESDFIHSHADLKEIARDVWPEIDE